MRSNKQSITTLTTITGTKSQIASSNSIIPSAFQLCHKIERKRSPQLTVSIMEQKNSNLIFSRQSTQVSVNQGMNIRTHRNEELIYQSRTTDLEIAKVLEKIFFKKKRYCFQVLKQFYLFPDESQSSIYSLSVYDPLIFHQEIIHSLVKIMETRLMANKIWAFLNLKMMPYLKAAKKIQEKFTEIQQKTIRIQKRVSFDMIKIAAEDAFSLIQKPILMKESRCLQVNTSFLHNQNKEVQCGMEQKYKKERKSCLKSNIVQEQVRPTIKVEPKKAEPVCQSTTKVYTRQQYELKYGKMKQRDENYEPKVVRISASDCPQRSTCQAEERTKIYTYQTQYKTPQINVMKVEQQAQVHTVQQESVSAKQIKSPRKYNIIHYHERPREISHPITVSEKKIHVCQLNTSCSSCLPCCNTSCCRCQQFVCTVQSRTKCCTSHSCCHIDSCDLWQKNDKLGDTRLTENVKFINGSKSAKIIYSSSQNPNHELSELESRIQYLNFLKSLAKQQGLQAQQQ